MKMKTIEKEKIVDQAEITGKMSKKEKEIAKWFLDNEWREAEKHGSFVQYQSSLGWIFYNSLILSDLPVIKMAFLALETIKKKSPGAYQSFMAQCKKDLNKLEPETVPGDIVPFPTAGGAK